MTKRIVIAARYPGDADTIFRNALSFDELRDAMSAIATYDGFPDGGVAEEGATYNVDVTMWGFLKTKGHRIFVERIDKGERILQSRESNPGVERWDHTISIQPDGLAEDGVPEDGSAIWTDTIVIDAGWRSPFVARFARYVYCQRHVRREGEFLKRDIA